MKSMNAGTPASVALPDRSSRGMIRSTRTATVAYSCAVKNFGLKALAFAAASACAAVACSCACLASAGVQTIAAATGPAVNNSSAPRREIFFIRASRTKMATLKGSPYTTPCLASCTPLPRTAIHPQSEIIRNPQSAMS